MDLEVLKHMAENPYAQYGAVGLLIAVLLYSLKQLTALYIVSNDKLLSFLERSNSEKHEQTIKIMEVVDRNSDAFARFELTLQRKLKD